MRQTRRSLVRWQFALSSLLVLGSAALADEPPKQPDGSAIFNTAPAEPSTPIESSAPIFAGPASGGGNGGLLAGNHNFPNFIGFISDPVQNIDPRAVTELYPIFGST